MKLGDKMKKRLVVILFIFCLLLVSCNQMKEYNILYVKTSYTNNSDRQHGNVCIIDNITSLNDYVLKEETSSLSNAVLKYDEIYFETNALALILIVESSGSNSVKVKSINIKDGIFKINIKRILPSEGENGTCDMAYWHILIELTLEEAKSIIDYDVTIK